MRAEPARARRWTRRFFVFAGAATLGKAAAAEKPQLFPSEWRRYPDPATELEVYRLTDPAHNSYLPAYYSRPISHREDFLLFYSDRAGPAQVLEMNLKKGECRQVTEAGALDGASVALLPDDRSFCFFDGPVLRHTVLRNLRSREPYRVPEGWERGPGSSLSPDGQYVLFAETRRDQWRLRRVRLRNGSAQTVIQTSFPISEPLERPRRDQILYRQSDQSLWLVNRDGQRNAKIRVPPGRIGPARWAPDGKTLLYLHFPEDRTQLHAIREAAPDSGEDHLVAKTSQFAHFGFNSDTSVFVGASQNHAAPDILLLLRVTRREFTLCEHKASQAAAVSPIFSPDSQTIYFQSDRHGKFALYRIAVEKLVEKTDDSA